jgi:hypothetical protein
VFLPAEDDHHGDHLCKVKTDEGAIVATATYVSPEQVERKTEGQPARRGQEQLDSFDGVSLP